MKFKDGELCFQPIIQLFHTVPIEHSGQKFKCLTKIYRSQNMLALFWATSFVRDTLTTVFEQYLRCT